ncbi:transposase [Vibrio splendidus 12B01]|nr:transposase [Vibrio splendidus 12B01]
MPPRALQGFIDSVFRLAHVPLSCTHYTCISFRAKPVEVSFKTKTRGAIQHLAMDTTSLKVYCEGEWKVRNTGRTANVKSGESCILPSIQALMKLLQRAKFIDGYRWKSTSKLTEINTPNVITKRFCRTLITKRLCHYNNYRGILTGLNWLTF